jgi:hypothetical protein
MDECGAEREGQRDRQAREKGENQRVEVGTTKSMSGV